MKEIALRADFFDNWDDSAPSCTKIIRAESEEAAIEKAAAQIGNAARVEFSPIGLRPAYTKSGYEGSRPS
jgi:ribosomal protein L20A (L18A)